MIAAIYLRVSTDEQAEFGFSIAGQREECRKKAQGLGSSEIIEFVDEGVSGSILERPGLLAGLQRLKAGGVGYLIALDTSRLSRSVAHQLLLLDEIKKAGVEVVFVNAKFSNDSPDDRFHLTILGAVDEYERARLTLRSALGKRSKAQAGKLTHSPGLYGYRFDIDTDTLSIVSEEANIIGLMHKWLQTENLSCYAIAMRLNSMGIPSPRGKAWSKQSVRRILGNESYTGTMTIRKHDATDVKLNKYKPDQEKAKRSIRPESEWVRIPITPIVTSPVWLETQRILEKARSRYRSYGKHQYMLSGLIRCGECGASLHGNLVKQKYAYYVCTAKSPGVPGKPRCKLSNIDAGQLDQHIWEHIRSWILDAEMLEHALSEALGDEEEGKLHNELQVVTSQHKDRLDERGRLVTLYQKRLLPEEDLEQRLRDVNDQISTLETRKADLEKQLERQALAQGEKNRLQELKEQVGSRLHSLSITERGVIAGMLIDRITVKKDSIEVKVRAPIPPTNAAIEMGAANDDKVPREQHSSEVRHTSRNRKEKLRVFR